MTTQELQDHIVSIRWNGYGAYRGSNNGYTYKQALQAFYDECKTLNNL